MAIKVSTGLANELTDRTCLRTNVAGGRLLMFTGSQPATADTASSGTLVCTVTNASGAYTAETLPVWTVALTGSSGTVDSIKIGGIELLAAPVTFTVDLTTTAAAVAAAITASYTMIDFTATGSVANVLISGPKGSGANLNSMVCTATATTMSATPASAGAVTTAGVTAVNGLQFSFPASDGKVVQSGTWSGAGVATGTAGYFRYCCDGADNGTSTSTAYRRIDGSITTTGGTGDIKLDNTSVTIGQTVALVDFYLGGSKG
jgi:hypothetical protein